MSNILLGVCGGISAYKSCELARELIQRGHTVRVIMTASGQKFVTPLTFESLTREPVYTDLFGDGAFGTAHIDLARWADVLVVAPATANTLSSFAQGRANDFLSVVYLACQKVCILVPAMNPTMWSHPATQENCKLLLQRGAKILAPQEGETACLETGVGRMMEPGMIADALEKHLHPASSLRGKKVVITAGATREYLDPARFLSSPSTGKMGLAIAVEACRRGATVSLIHAPWHLDAPKQIQRMEVTSAQEMLNEVIRSLPSDIFVGAAAVADYQPFVVKDQKMKKELDTLKLELKRTPDILEYVSKHRRPGDCVIGFAAETENLIPYAKLKLESKKLDLIVANEVFRQDLGFSRDVTSVTFVDKKGEVKSLSNVTKSEVAKELWDFIEEQASRTG